MSASFLIRHGVVPWLPSSILGRGDPERARLICYLAAHASRRSFAVLMCPDDPLWFQVQCSSAKTARRLERALERRDVTAVERQHGIMIRSICHADFLVRASGGGVAYRARSGPKHVAMRKAAEQWMADTSIVFEHDGKRGMWRQYSVRREDAALLKIMFSPELALAAAGRLDVAW